MGFFSKQEHKTWQRHVQESLLIGLLGSPMGFFWCTQCLTDLGLFLKVAFFSGMIWVVMWKGNEVIHIILDRRFPWLQVPVKRLTIGVILAIVYPIVAMFLLNIAFVNLWGFSTGQAETFWDVLKNGIPAVVVTFIVSTFLTARSFFVSWRQLAINAEKIKREVITSRYESLKNQVNPHFLFNSFNVLTTLVYQDQDLAARFIKQLSNVYRYVLDMKDQELVSVDKEIEFVKSYAFMQQIRHEKGLNISIDIPQDSNLQVAPLSIQMLVENAVKHNIIAKDEPLNIHIKLEGNSYIVVSNNLQVKPVQRNNQTHIGLENIKSRYEFLTEKDVVVEKDSNTFTVKLPILIVDNA